MYIGRVTLYKVINCNNLVCLEYIASVLFDIGHIISHYCIEGIVKDFIGTGVQGISMKTSFKRMQEEELQG